MQGKNQERRQELREPAANMGWARGFRSNSAHSGSRGAQLEAAVFARTERAMPRQLVWIENQHFQGYGCSQCNWVFRPSDELVANTLEEMKRKYEAQRDKEFVAHVCVKPGRVTNPKIG